MKHLKKTLSWLLAIALLLALVPASSLAASIDANAAAETAADETASETVDAQTAEEEAEAVIVSDADAAGGSEEANEAESASESNSGEDTSAEEETVGNSTDSASDEASSESETDSAAEASAETDETSAADGSDAAEEANASDESKENSAEEKEEAIAAAEDEIAEETEEMLLEDAGTVSEEAMADADTTQTDGSVVSLTSGGTTTYYDSLSSAVTASAAGDTLTLLSNITLSSYQVISKGITLDLGGYTLTGGSSAGYVLAVTSDDVVIQNGTIVVSYYIGLYLQNGSVSASNLTINANTSYGIGAYLGNSTSPGYYGNLTMDDTCTINCSGYYGVQISALNTTTTSTSTLTLNGSSIVCTGTADGVYIGGSSSSVSEASESNIRTYIVMNGGTISSANYSAIIGNGASHNTKITISDATLVSSSTTAIYHPQYGVMTISGSTITGASSGIEVRAGTVTITDSTISSTNTTYLGTYANGSGSSVAGAGIAVSQHSTNLPISVTITDCTVSGACAVYEEDQMDESSSNITISISGGTYTSYGTQKIVTGSDGTTETTTTANQSAVFSENVTAFISSGEFLSAVTSENGTVTTTTADIPLSYVSSSSVVVYISATDTTYVGTVSEINDYIAEAAETDDLGEGDTITVLSDGGLSEVALTVPDQVTVSNATSATVSLNDDSVIIAANGSAEAHDIVSIAKAATCTQTGYSDDAYQCTVCGTFFKGTTGTDGIVTYTECSEADLTIAIDEDAHNYDDGVYTAATCTEDGYTTYTCANDETHTYTVTDEGTATGHSYGEPVWTWEETDSGYTATATFTCANDSSHVVVSEAEVTSVTKDGVITYTATVTGPDGETVYTDTLETEAAADSEDEGEESEDDEDAEEDAEDEESALADTGDTLNLSLWFALLLMAGAAIAVLCARTRRK